jgi:MinD-like ATPase involved in chromosome partitioning or flagellar assembly
MVRVISNVTRASGFADAFVRPTLTGDDVARRTNADERTWRSSSSVELRPLPAMTARLDARSLRDLRDYGTLSPNAIAAGAERDMWAGIDVGLERERVLATSILYAPVAAAWLRPRLELASGYSLLRDPNAPGVRGVDDGVRLARRFGNSQRVLLSALVNQDPPQGIADAVFSPDRIDTSFIDRLLSKCTDHLSLLAAPATLERVYDFSTEAFDSIFDTLRMTMPCIILDVPHQWTGWSKRALINADEILVVAGPDLANLRNAKSLLDLLRSARPNDHRPYYCLNQVGVPKRPEIKPADFAKALDDDPLVVVPFEPQIFGTAANNGQMIAELSSSHRTAEMFLQLAQVLTGRSDGKRPRSSLLSPFLEKLMKRSA